MSNQRCKKCGRDQARITELENAIRQHRAQKADDRCIEDDDRLYAVLGDGIKCDRRVGDKFEMIKNCVRFVDSRCESGGWKTYAELEEEIDRLKFIIKGKDKAYNLMNKGMESQCDLVDILKQENRELKSELNKLKNQS